MTPSSSRAAVLAAVVLVIAPVLRADCVAEVTASLNQANNALLTYSYRGANNTPGRCGGIEIKSSWDGAPFGYVWGCSSCSDTGTQSYTTAKRCITPGEHDVRIQVTCNEYVGNSCVPDTGADEASYTVIHDLSLDTKLTPRAGGGYDLYAQLGWSDAQGSDVFAGWMYLPTRTYSGTTLSLTHHPDSNAAYATSIGDSASAELVMVGAKVCELTAFDVVSVPKRDKECCDCRTEKGTCVGAPIRVSNGNMHFTDRDPIPPFPGGLQRDYDSSTPNPSWFGKGWTSIIDDTWLRKRTEADGSTTVMIGTPANHRFVFNGSGTSFRQLWPKGSSTSDLFFDGTLYRLRENGSNTETTFDTSGHPTATRNIATGRQIGITYSGGAPASITDSWGNVTLTLATAGGRINSITDGSATWSYTYDGSGHLTAVTVNALPWRTYTYSGDRMTEAHDAAGNLVESHAYAANGTATSSIGGGREDITSITYAGTGRVTGEEITNVTTAAGATTSYYTRYLAGRERTVEIAGNCGSCGVGDAVFGFDGRGRVIREQDARGYFTERTFDMLSRELTSSGPWMPSSCDPETDSAHCRVTPDTILTTSLTSLPSTLARTMTYGDANWPDRPTEIDVASLSGSTNLKSESFTYDAATGATLAQTTSGYTGLPSLGTSESHTVTTALYNGTEGASFTPGGAFDTAWLTLAQPAGLAKSVDGPRTDVTDVTSFVYYPIDAAVPALNRGHLAAAENAAGHITRYENYDRFGNATRVIDPNGVVTESTYDLIGHIVTTTLKAASGCNTTADPLCATDLTSSRDYTPDTGPLTSQTDANGNATAYEYNTRGRMTATSRGPSLSDLRERMETSYDAGTGLKTEDRVYAKSGASWVLKKSESYAYDTFARLTTTTHADSTSVGYTYDPSSSVKTVRDENHASANTTYTYDPSRRLATVVQTLGAGSITTTYSYDFHGNLTSVTDPNGNVTTYLYDDFGRMLSQTSPVTGTTTYTYDTEGNLTSATDANGATTTRAYDELSRLTGATHTRDSESEELSWTYDDTIEGFGIGRLFTMTSPDSTTAYVYDRRGFITQESPSILGVPFTQSYQYDAAGNRTAIGYASGRVVTYSFDFAGRQLTASGLLNGVTTDYVTGASYRPFGPLTSLTFGNGAVETRAYDQRDRPSTLQLTAGPSTLASYSYGHDAAGNITAVSDLTDSSYDRTFAYDDLNRLATAGSGSSLWGSGGYTYDAMGNLLSATLGSRTRTFTYVDTSPRIDAVTDAGTTTSMTYDDAGNELAGPSAPSPFISDARVYSPRNLLQQFALTSQRCLGSQGAEGCTHWGQNTATTWNYYDARGVRVAMTHSNSIPPNDLRLPFFFYTPELTPLNVAFTAGDVQADVIWFAGRPVAQQYDGSSDPLFTITDHLGTPILQIDSGAAVIWRAEYEPFGQIYTMRAGFANSQPLRFPGQQVAFTNGTGEEESYNIFRWYRAGWGRYTQADPIGIKGGLNLYRYANANPIGAIDPTGLAVNLVCRRVNVGQGLLAGLVGAWLVPVHCRLEVSCACDRESNPRTPFRKTVGLEATGGGYQLNTDNFLAPRFGGPSQDYDKGWFSVPVTPPSDAKGCGFERCILNEARARENTQSFPSYNIAGPNSNSYVRNLVDTCGGSAEWPKNAYGADPNPFWGGNYRP
jgi:RHS repeat-associated protein